MFQCHITFNPLSPAPWLFFIARVHIGPFQSLFYLTRLQVYGALERRYEERVAEVRQLEGQLADFNLAFDKVCDSISVSVCINTCVSSRSRSQSQSHSQSI